MKYPGGNAGQSGETVDYGYASTGAVKSVTQHLAATPYVQNTTYDESGRIAQRIFGNNLFQTNYTYFPYTTANGLGRLQQVTAGVTGNLTSLQDLRYTYGLNGNVLTIQDWKAGSPQTQTFTYDDLDRLLTAGASGGTGGTYSESYVYNSIGNLTSKGGVTLSYAAQSATCPAGALTKPHAAVSRGTNTYCYDQNGNQVQRNVGSTVTLTYNHDNQLTATSGGATSSFVYDGDGNRVKGTVAGVTTTYVGAHYEVEGATTRKYYYLGGQRVAMLENSTVYYLLGDHLGSTALTVNSAGAKYGELRYKAFGETRYTFGTTPTSFAFTGQRQESGLGLYFYNARWYDPGLGRFIQADTVVPSFADPQSLNRFSYVGNNPLKYVDPSGHTKLCGAACEDELDKKWSPPKSSSGSGGGGGGNGPNGGWGPTIPVGPQGGSSGNVGDVPTESQSEGDHDEPCNPTSCNPSYMSLSIGIDLPTVIMGTGALISLADGLVPAFDSVGLPIVLVGALLETCAGTGIPLCVAIKLTSIGGVATVDDYGNVYAGPQLSFGKSVTPFIGGEFDMGFIINGDGRHASEDTTEKFLSGFSVSGGTIATGGIAYSPSLNKSAYYMVGLPSLGSINASYTWMIYDNP